jgi:hypothetical protein
VQYTIVITKERNMPWRAVATELPQCVVEAPTRDEAIAEIKNRILKDAPHVEVLKLELPDSLNGNSHDEDSIRSRMGIFKDDPTLDEMFDEIERRRDQNLIGGE